MSEPMIKVSVICAWYNRAEYIRDTVDSLLSQDLKDFEVNFVNDGSPDPEVRMILDSYSDPRLRVFHRENVGIVKTFRFAIEQSRGEFIAVQGAGDISYPKRLRLQLDRLERNPQFAGTGCGIRNIWVGGDNDGKTNDHQRQEEVFDHRSFLQFSNPLSHGEVMFRRDIYDKVGGYRPFFHFAQDRDLWIRMSEHADFTNLHEVLYERRKFTSDGVAASYNKSLSQMRYSYIARDCAAQRAAYGTDIVEMFGAQAALFRKNQRGVAHDMAKIALKYLAHEMPDNARFLARMAMQEQVTHLTLASRAVASLAARSPVACSWLAKTLQRSNFRDFRAPEPFVPERSERTSGDG